MMASWHLHTAALIPQVHAVLDTRALRVKYLILETINYYLYYPFGENIMFETLNYCYYLGEAAVLLQLVGDGEVPVCMLSLGQEDRVVEEDRLAPGHPDDVGQDVVDLLD